MFHDDGIVWIHVLVAVLVTDHVTLRYAAVRFAGVGPTVRYCQIVLSVAFLYLGLFPVLGW